MHRTFILINEDSIQGAVLSDNNDIITINTINFDLTTNDLWLNKNVLHQYIKELINKLEQICTVSITNIYLGLHAFIDYNCIIKVNKDNVSTELIDADNIKIDEYKTFYIQNKHYLFDFDTQFTKYFHTFSIYINQLVYEYLNIIFGYNNIKINQISFAPLKMINQIKTNSIIAFLYNTKLVLAIKKDNNINVFAHNLIDDISNINIQTLNFAFGDISSVSYTRKFLNQINEYINQYLYQYSGNFHIYFTGKFTYIPDMIDYIRYLNNNTHTYEFLDNKNYNISENTILYGSLLNFINAYI